MVVSKMVLGVVLSLLLAACGSGNEAADIGSAAATTSPEPSTTTLPATTTSAPSPSTTAARATGSTARVTTTRQPTTTRASAPTTTTTAATPGQPHCSDVHLAAAVTTTRATYRPGEPVQVQSTVRNRSSGPCFYATYKVFSRIEDASERETAPPTAALADTFADTPLAAGETLRDDPQPWNQQACVSVTPQCAQAQAGTYTVKVSWLFEGTPVEASTTFRLVPA